MVLKTLNAAGQKNGRGKSTSPLGCCAPTDLKDRAFDPLTNRQVAKTVTQFPVLSKSTIKGDSNETFR
jgi:hypothetical protein